MRIFLLMLSLLGVTWAAPLTQGERDRAMSELHATRKNFLDSIAGLTEAQWNFKPDANTWSIAECAEHIALSEDLLLGRVQKIAQSPAETSQKSDITDEMLLRLIVDRSHKAQAPEVLRPTHRWATQAELVNHFKQSRDRTIDYVRTTQDDLRGHFAPHPVFKTLDAYQWILLLAGHSARHTLQLNEVKTNPNFPK